MEHLSGKVRDHHIAAVIIFTISIVGSTAHWLIVTSSQRLPSMRNSFGLLMTSQSTSEAVLCSIFAFFYSPMVFFDIDMMKNVSKQFGIVLPMCYDICLLSHMFIALNRMCAIYATLKYDRYFSLSNTKKLIAISWTISITRCLISYFFFDCDFVYDGSKWTFVFTQTKDCLFISHYLNFYRDLIIIVIIGVVDIITVIKVHITSRQMLKSGVGEPDGRRKKEINFLKQAVLQGIVFAVELYTYFHLAWQYQDKWHVFLLTTVTWNLLHCTDGLIVIGYNAEFRKLVLSPKTVFKGRNTVVHEHYSSRIVRLSDK